MKTIAILKKKVASAAIYSHYTQFNVGRPTALCNDYSHLPTSAAKYRVSTLDQAVSSHKADFINRLKNYKLPENREMLVYLRRIYDSAVAGNEVALVCHCGAALKNETIKCHSVVLRDFLYVLLEDYAQHGMQYCVDKFVAAQAPTMQSFEGSVVNLIRTGQWGK